MSNRGRKRGSHTSGLGRGDRGGLNGGKSQNPRMTPYCDGAYRNKHFVHAITSLVGCNVELRKSNGEIYHGVFNTVSPQGDIVLTMASRKERILSKSSFVQTLCVPWMDIVVISSLSGNEDKDIFRTDREIGNRSNGVPETRELQRFEFEESTGKALGDGGIVEANLDSRGGWNAEEMFGTNQEKFDVKSSFNPEMLEYTTSLELKDNEADRQRVIMADKKAREIEENSSKQYSTTVDDVGTEEDLFSAVVHQSNQETSEQPPSQPELTSQLTELADLNKNSDSGNGTVKIETESEPDQEVTSNDVPSPNVSLDNDPDPSDRCSPEAPPPSSADNVTTAPVEPEIINPQETTTEGETDEASIETPDEIKKTSFKLNPDAMEFTPTLPSTSPPLNSQSNISYPNTRSGPPRQKGPRGPRPSNFSDQPGLFGYHQPLQQTPMRPIMHPQTGLTSGQIPGHLTTPTNLIMRQPMAGSSPMIGQQNLQSHIYSTMAQSPMMGLGQQIYIPSSQSPTPAMFTAHPSLIPASGTSLPQSQVVFLQGPPVPQQAFVQQQQGFIPPAPQMGGVTPTAQGGIMTYNQQQQTSAQLGKQ